MGRWCILLAILAASAGTHAGVTTRVSLDSNGNEGNADSSVRRPAISGDGRYVAFASLASNLVAGDTNGVEDVFVHDRETDTTIRISVASAGSEGNARANSPAITPDGRYVAFVSFASNLVPGDTNGAPDVFVRDRDTDGDGVFDESGAVSTTRISVDSAGIQGDNSSVAPSISADGRDVAFQSFASNLVAVDTNGTSDIFVHNRQAGATIRISVDNSGNEGNGFSCCPAISGNGRFASYASGASNLVASDTNSVFDLFVHDLLLGVTTRVSVDSNGAEGDGSSCCSSSISADGLLVAFRSASTNLVLGDTNTTNDLFVHDRLTGVTTRVSVDSNGGEANDASFNAAISADGRFVAFGSEASDLVAGDTNGKGDFFLHDRQTGATTRISVATNGDQGNDASIFAPAISADGRIIAFPSEASNLVAGDTNGARDVFVHDRLPTPQQAFDMVAGQLNTLLAAQILNRGQANALTNKLSAMLAALAQDNVRAAIGKLGAFLNQLDALVAGSVLSADEAQPLRDTAIDLLQRLDG